MKLAVHLASASPRRRELLAHLGVPFDIVVSDVDEATIDQSAGAEAYVRTAAEAKALDVALRHDGLALGVDTDVVDPDGRILGKPANPEEAATMLRSLAGRTHTVLSGVALMESRSGEVLRRDSRLVRTFVTFAPLDESAVAAYVATPEPYDKAGGYGMQGRAMAFVARIDGDPSNVIGLPLWTVAEMLAEFGVRTWPVGSLQS
ncbi:MAG: Maf family protein [Armatimonadota bacterium]